jgi:PAS domain S-box-containing protein
VFKAARQEAADNGTREGTTPENPGWWVKLPEILSHFGAGIAVWDSSGVVEANEALSNLTGYSSEELLASPSIFAELLEKAPIPWRASKDGDQGTRLPGRWEATLKHRDGHSIPVQVWMTAVEADAGGEVVVTLIRDLTERHRIESELKTRARQQAAVVELGQRALAGTDLSELNDRAVAIVAQTLEVEYAKVLEFFPDREVLLLRSGVGWREGYVGKATVGSDRDSQAGYTLLSDRPVVVEDLAKETRFTGPQLLIEHGVVSGMSVVIRGKDRPYGVLGTHTTQRRTFSHDDINFLQAMANVLAEAIGRKRVEEVLRRARDQERELRARLEAHSRLVVDAQESERRHIARELHDETAQALTGLKLTLENLERAPAPELELRLRRARGLVGELMTRVHDLSLDLRPHMLDDLGLLPALLWLVERYSDQTRVKVDLEHSGLHGRLAPEVETAAYRIVQEALTNVARHARTACASVRCVAGEDALFVEVGDEGAGFDAGAARAGTTSGLAGMEARARAMGGQLTIASQPGGGTRVVAELPLRGVRAE